MEKLAHLFFVFFKIGAFTIGGGYAILPIIQDEVVDSHDWMTDEEFLNSITLTNSIPGPLATNTATFVGYHIMGFKRALVTILGAINPSILIILLVASAFEYFVDSPIAQALFGGIRLAVVALILYSVFKLGKSVKLGERYNWLLMILVFLAISVSNVRPIFIIVAGTLFGIFVKEKL